MSILEYMSRVNVAIHDLVTTIIDVIDAEPDPTARLVAYRYLERQVEERLLLGRDRSAYEARKSLPADLIASKCDVPISSVYYWADRHRLRTGSPALTRRMRPGLDAAVDLDVRGK